MHSLTRIIQAFGLFPDWEDRYRLLTDIGESMPPLPAVYQTEANRVHGCMSKVWVVGEVNRDGILKLRADCDTPVVKGLVALLLIVFQDKTPDEVIATDVDALFQELGLDENLSPNRHVGMYAMVDKIRDIAHAQLQQAA
jgi:cysteine desulfuration protein SufE